MKRSALLHALQNEIRRHTFDYFVESPPAVAKGGHGVVVPGCPECRKRINTMAQFLDHLADDVLPGLFDKLTAEASHGLRHRG
jgi:hypothetical protein